MEKYIDRDEVKVIFTFDDKTKHLVNIAIEVRDKDFFPSIDYDDPSLKSDLAAWIDTLQNTLFGFLKQAPRKIEAKPHKSRDMGENAIPNPIIENKPMSQYERTINTRVTPSNPVRAICPDCGEQLVLEKGCCGAGGTQIYKGKCRSCGRPVNIPEAKVRVQQ